MALDPISFGSGASGANQVNLNFTNGHIDLSNVDFYATMQRVIHKLQAKGIGLASSVSYREMNSLFEWVPLVNERNPLKRTTESPTINSRASEFSSTGLTVHTYDDDSLVPEFTESFSKLAIKTTVLESMYMGFQRLLDKLILTACVQPRVEKDTGSGAWKSNTLHSVTDVALPDAQIGARVSLDGSNAKLEFPNFQTLQEIKERLYEGEVDRSAPIHSILTPQMETVIESMSQYNDRDYIFADTQRALMEKQPIVPFYGIMFHRISEALVPVKAFDSKYLPATASNLTQVSSTSAATSVDLYSGASAPSGRQAYYSVMPFWIPDNLVWGEKKDLYKAEIYKVPYYKQTPLVTMSMTIGATRIQDKAHYNLIVPRS